VEQFDCLVICLRSHDLIIRAIDIFVDY